MNKIEVSSRVLLSIVALLISLISIHMYEINEVHNTSTISLSREAVKSVVVIECVSPSKKKPNTNSISTTAGFVASVHGHIITVAHGLTECLGAKENKIVVRFWEDPSKAHRAKIIRINTHQDVAVLQVPTTPEDIIPLEMDPEPQSQGRRTIAIGHPQLFYWSVSEGVVSADRIWEGPYRHLIQVDTPINPGNSGGPILNEKGQVVGIASFNIDGNPTLSFIVPMDTVLRLTRGIYF